MFRFIDWSPSFIQVSLVLSNVLPLLQDPIQDTRSHLGVISFGSSWLWQFLRLCFSFLMMTLAVLKNTGQIFYSLSLRWDISDVFPMIRLGFLGVDHTFSLHHIKGTCSYQHHLSLLMMTFITWLRECLSC